MNVVETELYLTLLLSEKTIGQDDFESLKSDLINQYRTNLANISLPEKAKTMK